MDLLDPKRLRMLHVALYRENTHERSNAASAYYNYFRDVGLHPADVNLSIGSDLLARNMEIIESLHREIARLDNENLYLRRHVGPDVIKAAWENNIITYRWFEFVDLVWTRFVNENNTLPKNWRTLVGRATGSSLREIARWEQGISHIPDQVFAAIEALPSAAPDRLRPNRKRNERRRRQEKAFNDQYSWSDEMLRMIVTMYLDGATRPSIIEAAQRQEPRVTPNMIIGKLDNSPPPKFLHVGIRYGDHPIDWPEIWLIGWTLFCGTKSGKRVRGWRTEGLRAIGLQNNIHPPAQLNFPHTQEKIAKLRNDYINQKPNNENVETDSEIRSDAMVK